MEYEQVWKKVLRNDEEVKFEFSVGKKYRMFYLILLSVLASPFLIGTPVFGIILIGIVLFYFGFYLKTANAYAITNKRVLIHRGWLSTSAISIEFDKITDVSITEPFIERLVTKSGNIAINTAGSGTKEVILKHVQTPYEVRKQLDSIRA